MNEVTHLLKRIDNGDHTAGDALLPLLYDELRELARLRMAAENPGQTIQPTALVHEAWLRLVGNDNRDYQWHSRGHFFAAAAEAMRRVLIDRARHKKSQKEGGNRNRLFLDSVDLADSETRVDVLDLEIALQDFEAQYPDHARIVELKFFAGLSHDEISTVLKCSESTVKRQWRFAKVWLHRRLEVESGPGPD